MSNYKIEFIAEYIEKLETEIENFKIEWSTEEDLFKIIRECTAVFNCDIPDLEDRLAYRSGYAVTDAEIVIAKLRYKIVELGGFFAPKSESKAVEPEISVENTSPLIFLSHKSDDKKYGHALRDFIVGLGVNDSQLVYTSHDLNKIPLDNNIYDYLRTKINSNVFMIILWSDKYLESPACLNEMGAAWVVQADYTNVYVPSFNFDNPKYHECAVDTAKIGVVLNGNSQCRANMLELKKKIVEMFNLEVDESKTLYLLDEFTRKITNPSEEEIVEALSSI